MLQGISDAVDVVINPKKSLLAADFQQISQEIERALRVIRQHCQSPAKSADAGAKTSAGKATQKKRGKQEARP
jgi:RNase P protein component